MSTSTLIHGGQLAQRGGHLQTGWVLVEGERISRVEVGTVPSSIRSAVEKEFDATEKLVLPGFVNAHTHLCQTLLRNAAVNESLDSWLAHAVRPMQRLVTPDDVYYSTLLALHENLSSGVTALVQHHKVVRSTEHIDAALRAWNELPIRMLFARACSDIGSTAEPIEIAIRDLERLRATWRNTDRLDFTFGPTSPNSCSRHAMSAILELAADWGVPVHLHIAETKTEIQTFYSTYNMSPVRWLSDLARWDAPVHLVHSVWLTEDDLAVIADRGWLVVHCPVSNMYLASGAAPIASMLARSIPVALGCDGSASSGGQNYFEVLRSTALLSKLLTSDPAGVTPPMAIKMATESCVGQLGRVEVAELRPGSVADLLILDLNTPWTVPVHNPLATVVYSAGPPNVSAVIIAGEILKLSAWNQGPGNSPLLQTIMKECAARARSIATSIAR